MSDSRITTHEAEHKKAFSWLLGVFIFAAALTAGAVGYLLMRTLPMGQIVSNLFTWLFATNSSHATWYVTRAAGWVAYFLLWFSMLWGLAIPTKFFQRLLSPTFVVDFHEYISLLAIGFVVIHVGVLLIDQYLPFTLAQVLVPFAATYQPFWVGLGTIGAYLSLLVTITFYLRKRIGQKRFKAIHTLSMAGYLGVVLHAFFSGSDSALPVAQLIYLGTFLVVVFLTAYWLINAKQLRAEKEQQNVLHQAHRPVKH